MRFDRHFPPWYDEHMIITGEMRGRVAAVAAKHGLKLVVLFGSAAAGTERADSDVDIAVKFGAGDCGLGRFFDVQHELSAMFGERHVDLSVLDHADPFFMKKIAERHVFLYADPGEDTSFLLLAFKRYQDHRPYLAMERRYVREYVNRRSS